MTTPYHRPNAILQSLRSFRRKEDGAIGIAFALLALPLIALTGGGVDYSNHMRARSALQSGADAAALAAQKQWVVHGQDASSVASAVVKAQLPQSYELSNVTVDTTRVDNEVTVVARGEVDNAFLGLLGMNRTEIGVSSTAEWTPQDIEVALAIDMSGSMNGTKVNKAKQAMLSFSKTLYGTRYNAQRLAMGAVPWNTTVNVGTDRADWLRGPAPLGWDGCINVRTDNFGTTATPDEEPFDVFTGPYMHSATSKPSDYRCIKDEILPLTEDRKAFDSWVKSLSTANGDTVTSLGTGWGARLLDPKWSDAWGDEIEDWGAVKKYFILLADGQTYFPLTPYNYGDTPETDSDGYTSYGRDVRQRFKSSYVGLSSDAEPTVDKHALMHCDYLKSQDKTEIFTIQYATNSAAAKAFLKRCASSASHYIDVSTPGALDEAFGRIAEQILEVRLTR